MTAISSLVLHNTLQQEENEIPSSVFVKDPPPFPRDAENESMTLNPNPSQEELHTIQLSSDEELGPEEMEDEEEEEEEFVGMMELVGEPVEKSRAEKIKRSSLKKVDSLKKAFSRKNIEKKMNKIVSPEQREKIMKSLTPSHQKSPGTKSSSFKVSPIFSRKKVKDVQEDVERDQPLEEESLPIAAATIELNPADNPDQNLSFTHVHSQLAPDKQEVKAAVEPMEKDGDIMEKDEGIMEKDEGIMEEDGEEGVSEGYALSATLLQDSSTGEDSHNAPHKDEGSEEDEDQQRDESIPVQPSEGAVES